MLFLKCGKILLVASEKLIAHNLYEDIKMTTLIHRTPGNDESNFSAETVRDRP